ncbi:MAG: HlyD family efflux transporter periplasmic adaptor subunit [Magnetococcales bacterium]|nr:HlyD family efflux transporter periplasmic adaptor subunit [Magnetococcales bacterium]
MPAEVLADPARATRKLTAVLELEATLRGVATTAIAARLLVHETRSLMGYRQGVLLGCSPGGRWRVRAVSDVVDPDCGGPFLLWLRAFVPQWLSTHGGRGPQCIVAADLPEEQRRHWLEWLPGFGYWIPLESIRGNLMGGLLLFCEKPLSQDESWLLGHLCSSYSQSWERLVLLEQRTLFWRVAVWMTPGRTAVLTLMLVVALAFVPVHLTVLAPARIVPVDPVVISSPLDGVVAQVLVQPNQEVDAGTLLFRLEATELENRHAVALKALEVESANLEKAQRKGFHDDRSRSEVSLLQATVAMKEAEAQFAAQLLALVEVRATKAGVVVFNDPNQWLGQPVKVGETVMLLADPRGMELEAWIPVADAIALDPGARVLMFLNIHPHQPLAARLRMADFEARQAPDGFLGFRVRAGLDAGGSPVRFGLRGSARFQGEEVRLWYFLLRRPLAFLRQQVGW